MTSTSSIEAAEALPKQGRRLLFQKWDVKARMWATHLRPLGVQSSGMGGSPIQAPLRLLGEITAGRKPDAYVFRYLNDYQSLAKTLLRFGSEVLLVVIARLAAIRILWIFHNVDRESSEFWPRITALRRRFIARSCSGAFVTDPLLVADAKQRFPVLRWQSAPFGIQTARPDPSDECRVIIEELTRLRAELAEGSPGPVFIGLCATSMSDKCAHLFRFAEVLETGHRQHCSIGILFVGAFSKGAERWKRVLDEIRRTEQTKALDVDIDVDEDALAPHFDFIYRSLSDLSVAYSFYRAAAVGKPIVTHDVGLGARIVEHYKVGLISNPEAPGDWPAFFRDWSADRWDTFLAERSWSIGARRLAEAAAGGYITTESEKAEI